MRKKVKRSAIALSAVLAVLVISLGVGLTIAYLGRTVEKENTIIVGHGDAEISEEFSEPSVQKMTNEEIPKEVTVKNTGTVPCFVRVFAEFSDSKAAEAASIYLDGTPVVWKDFKISLTNGTLTSDWVFIPLNAWREPEKLRGYFYYKKILAPGESTAKLFDGVATDFRADEEDSNIDRIIPYDMIIYSETVQTVETGVTEVTSRVNGLTQTSSVYGFEYTEEQWKDAWTSFLQADQ